MPATAIQSNPKTIPTPVLVAQKQQRNITWEEFEKRYLQREDGYKYEWIEGQVEKTERNMYPTQVFIQFNLQDFFMELKVAGKVKGQLLAETDLFFLKGVHRRPDFAWLTRPQANRLSAEGALEVPDFVIEVISNRDSANKLVDKMKHYRAAKVKIVWQIYPKQQEVHVYSGDNLEDMQVCTGDKICSAAPVLPNFALPAKEIFVQKED